MRLVLSRRLADAPVDRAQWNALVAGSPNATIFQTYEWFECWWSAFGQDRELFLVTVWDGDALAGIAPLMTFRRAGLRRLEFVGTPNADYQDFILGRRAAELLPLLAGYLFEHRDDWDMVALRNVPMESATFQALPVIMRTLGLGATDLERVACPTFEVSSRPAEIRQWLNRYSLRRRLKHLQRHGQLAFTRFSTIAQLDRYLPMFFEQYIERRRGTAAARVFIRPEVRKFYAALAKSTLTPGWLHFSVLECAGRPVAFHFGFEFRDRLYWYKPSFDPALARHSPGKVLLSFLIRDSLERGLTELDFTVGAEPFKARYTRTHRINANLRIFSRRWHYLAFMSLIRANRTLVRWGLRPRPEGTHFTCVTTHALGRVTGDGVAPVVTPAASETS